MTPPKSPKPPRVVWCVVDNDGRTVDVEPTRSAARAQRVAWRLGAAWGPDPNKGPVPHRTFTIHRYILAPAAKKAGKRG